MAHLYSVGVIIKIQVQLLLGLCLAEERTAELMHYYFFFSFLFSFRYSNLILNLFSLMVDANIPDIALEPDKTVKKVIFIHC